MKYVTLLACVLLSATVLGQKKSELEYEIFKLKQEVRVKEDSIAELRKVRASNSTRLASAEMELTQLREDNAKLLERLNRFTSESVTRTESIAKGLETLRAKEQEILQIRDGITANDSITIMVLTQLTQLLGKDPSLRVENGSVLFKMNPALFGLTDSIATNARIRKLDELLTAQSSLTMDIRVPNADGSEVNEALGVGAFAGRLREYYNTHPELYNRVSFTLADTRNPAFTASIQPDYKAFYLRMRESLK